MPSLDPSRPNVLFILSDDQGYWAMGCAGHDELRTPHLDRLARTGTRFDQFFCASPVCSPARATLLTGKIPSQHGVQDFLREGNTAAEGTARGPIEYLRGHVSYTEILATTGYDCALSGKWHLGSSHLPQKGFGFWNVHATGSGPYYNAPMFADGKPYSDPRYVTDLITDNALEYLDARVGEDRPFSLNVHYTAPHAPWMRQEHPDELYDAYLSECAFASTPDEGMHPEQLYKEDQMGTSPEMRRKVLAGYFSAVTAMDRNIGRLLDWLEANGLRENTMVFFTSDNGMSMGHHGIYGKGNGTFPPNMYDTAVKIPAIVSRPGGVPEGQLCTAMLSQYDWMPTLLDYLDMGEEMPPGLPGRSFAAVLRGEELALEDRIVVYDEYGPTRMIRNREWKYVHRYPFGPHELYHLIEDPEERTNLADDEACRTVRAGLRHELEQWFRRYVDPAYDGAYESVMGRGQLDLVGPRAHGRQRFGHDVVYLTDVEPRRQS